MPRVAHFEFAAEDPERAVKFYEQVFGWKIQKWDGPMEYWLVMTEEGDEPGIDGAIMPRTEGAHTIVIMNVSSIDEYVQKIVAAGGQVVMAKQVVPGIGYLARCADTEGVVFGLMQADPSAQ